MIAVKLTDGHEWAHGCTKCTYGIKAKHYTPPSGAVEIVFERLVLAEQIGSDYFCGCPAGQALRKNLLRVREAHESWRDRFGAQDVAFGRIVLDQARQIVRKWQDTAPTVHLEPPQEVTP